MANVSFTKNKSKRSLKARESVQDQVELPASNPFDTLCDGDSGDDIVARAVAQLEATSLSKAEKNKSATNVTNGKQKANKPDRRQYTQSNLKNNKFSGKGREINYWQCQNVSNGRGGAGQRIGYAGYNNRFQNGWYHGNAAKSSGSSNGINDGASDNAERSSVKSEREQREEEFQKKLKEFKYNPEEEDKWKKFLRKFDDIKNEKETAIRKAEALLQEQKREDDVELIRAKVAKAVEERSKLMEEKTKALEYIRLSNNKKMTLDEFQKMKEEQKKALGAPTGERRVVMASDFDGLVAVARRDFEEDGLSNPRTKAEKSSEAVRKEKKKKKKKATLFVIGGSQSQGLNFSQKQGQGRQAQPLNKNGAAAAPAPDNFPLLRNSAAV